MLYFPKLHMGVYLHIQFQISTTSYRIYWDNYFLQMFSPSPSINIDGLKITSKPCCEQITNPQHWYKGGEGALNGDIFKLFERKP